MYPVYEVIEVLPNGSRPAVTVASSLEFAKAVLEELTNRTHDECLAVDAKTHQVVMQLNVESAKLQATKRVLQVAYDEELALQRTQLPKSRGYMVMSVIGNEAAKVVLSSTQHYDLSISSITQPRKKPGKRSLIGSGQTTPRRECLHLIRLVNKARARISISRARPLRNPEGKMARYLRIRHVVKTDRPSAHEQIQAICGNKPDGSHWSLTQDEAIAQVEDGISLFYVESVGGRRFDVIAAMDLHARKYLKTVADREQPDELLYLPSCHNLAHGRSMAAGR